jgi:hypothetical protein
MTRTPCLRSTVFKNARRHVAGHPLTRSTQLDSHPGNPPLNSRATLEQLRNTANALFFLELGALQNC